MEWPYSFLLRYLLHGILLTSCFLPASAYKELSLDTLENLAEAGPDFDIHTGALLAPILQPRVPGTPGSLKVLQHFVDFFRYNLPDWKVELHNSTSTTPATGDRLVPFVNFIATRDPPWSKDGHVSRLALTAHYDSLIKPEGFIGAIDSAAPCAMIMHTVRHLDAALTKKWQDMETNRDGLDDFDEDKGIQVILFDGEEAFVHWTATDSVYGSRALAEHWDSDFYDATSVFRNPMGAISLFVLLDLLGSANPFIPSYFGTTHWAYRAMSNLEGKFRSNGLFKSSPNHRSKRVPDVSGSMPPKRQERLWLAEAEKTRFGRLYIGDDHEPFMVRGVQILHMIPSPFPAVWHTIEDDGEHLDSDTVEDWAKLVMAFTAEYMDLDAYLSPKQQKIVARDVSQKSEL